MDQSPLVNEQIDAGQNLIRKFNDEYKTVQSAFWLREGDGGEWYLYIISPQIDDSNFDQAYGEVIKFTSKSPSPWLDPFQIKVAGVNNPFAIAVDQIQQRYSASLPTRLRNRMLGGIYVDEAYVYEPLPSGSASSP